MPSDAPATVLRSVSYVNDAYAESSDGTRIHYYTIGEQSPAFVCCDGIGCDGYAWKYIVQDFAPEHRIVRWHYRAHGSSGAPRDRSRMRIDDIIEDLRVVLDANEIDKAILLGHSLGVQVILEFHRRYPERVLGLVPMCGSYGHPLDTFHDGKVLKTMFPLVSKLIHRYPDAAKKLWTLIDSEFAYQFATRTEINGALIRHEDFRPYLQHIGHIDTPLFATLLQDASEHDAFDHLDQIDVPTLIFAGEKDTFTPHWLSEVMHSRIRGSELCTIPGGTHTAPIEIPELVSLRLQRFLDMHFAAGAETQPVRELKERVG